MGRAQPGATALKREAGHPPDDGAQEADDGDPARMEQVGARAMLGGHDSAATGVGGNASPHSRSDRAPPSRETPAHFPAVIASIAVGSEERRNSSMRAASSLSPMPAEARPRA